MKRLMMIAVWMLGLTMALSRVADAGDLHWAVMTGNLDVVTDLLEQYPDIINVKDEHGQTALYWAGAYQRKEIGEFLIAKGADVDVLSASALGLGAELRTMLEKDASAISVRGVRGETALHYAASEEIAASLLSANIDVHARDEKGWTALHQAAFHEREEVVEYLVSNGAVMDIFAASALGRVNAIKNLLVKDPGVAQVQAKSGDTPLHLAKTKATVLLLIEAGAGINVRTKQDLTPLHRAVLSQNEAVATALVEAGAHVNTGDMRDWTALHWAAINGNVALAELLVNNGARVNTQANRHDMGSSPLHKAAEGGHVEVVTLLLKHGAKVDIANGMRETPLFSAKNVAVAKLLIAHGAEINHIANGKGTALHEAENVEIAELLLVHGAAVNARDAMDRTPLDKAVRAERLGVARFLADKGGTGEPSSMAALADGGTDEEEMDIFKAAAMGLASTVIEFVETDKAWVTAKGGCAEETALHLAATREVAEILIAAGADVHVKDSFGYTPLYRAAEEGRIEVVRLLIANGADVNARNSLNVTALHGAAENGHKDMVEILLDAGAEINVVNSDHRSPLSWAIEMGHREVAELLISRGATQRY